jgi:hypothetical protein
MKRWIGAAVGTVAVGVAVAAVVVNQAPTSELAALPPTAPTPDVPSATVEPPVVIPEGLLPIESRASSPPADPEAHWERADRPDLPPLVSPCGGYVPSDGARVAARQVALVHPSLWKVNRLVVYRDEATATAAIGELRGALDRCARHEQPDGSTTRWTSEPMTIGDEALFVGGQRYRGDAPIHGHTRGVIARQGRAILMYVDFGQLSTPPVASEVQAYLDEAPLVADALARAPWNEPPTAASIAVAFRSGAQRRANCRSARSRSMSTATTPDAP